MGYISYTAANTSGAQTFSDAMVKINRFNNDLLSNMKIIESSDGTYTFEQKLTAYQFLSDFYNDSETGEYHDLVGNNMDALRPELLVDVETELKSQQISIPIDNNGNYTNIMYNGHIATSLDLLQHWNDTAPLFTFSWETDEGPINVPWSDKSLTDVTDGEFCSDLGQAKAWGQSIAGTFGNQDVVGDGTAKTYTDATGQHNIPGGGINVHTDFNMTACEPGEYDVSASGSAQAIAGFTKTTNVNADPSWNFEEQYKSALEGAGFSTAS